MRSSSRRWLHSLGTLALVAPSCCAGAEGTYDALLAPAVAESPGIAREMQKIAEGEFAQPTRRVITPDEHLPSQSSFWFGYSIDDGGAPMLQGWPSFNGRVTMRVDDAYAGAVSQSHQQYLAEQQLTTETSYGPIYYVGNLTSQLEVNEDGDVVDVGQDTRPASANAEPFALVQPSRLNALSYDVAFLQLGPDGHYHLAAEFSDWTMRRGVQLNSVEISRVDPILGLGFNSGRWRFDAFAGDIAVGGGGELLSKSSNAKGSGLVVADPHLVSSFRYQSLESAFGLTGFGSTPGPLDLYQSSDHYSLLYQIGPGVVAETGIFRFEGTLLAAGGVGWNERDQYAAFGAGPLSPQPGLTRSRSEDTDTYFAWNLEARCGAQCQVTQRLRLDVLARWYALGPTYDPVDSIAWVAPTFGIRDTDSRTAHGSNFYVGGSYVW